MINARLARKNKEVSPRSWELLKGRMIEKKIRARYSISDELAILRQRDTKPSEFAEYNAFVEQCKAEVMAKLN